MRRPAEQTRLAGSGLAIGTAALALLPVAAWAQPAGPHPEQPFASGLEGLAPLSEVVLLETPPISASFSRAVNAEMPFRFAEPYEVQVNPSSHGRWETVDDGKTAVWRLRVVSPGALSLNLGFTRYRMPPSGWLRVYTPDGSEALRPFTDADNEDHGELWTPLVRGDGAVIEVVVPAARIGELELELESVNRGVHNLTPPDLSCQIDAACSVADPYRDQARSVALLIMGGNTYCTGTLVNNTARDGKPYMITGCGLNALGSRHRLSASTVVYWNYESAACGDRRSKALGQYQTGAYFRAHNDVTRTLLIELDDELDPDFNAYHAGWDRSDAEVTSAFTFHHPAAHVKSINVAGGDITVGPYRLGEQPDDAYLIVDEWDQGATSSFTGAGLFNQDKRFVGQFRDGVRRCHSTSAYGGVWGRLAKAWDGPDRTRRLKDWLDPGATGATTLDGMYWNTAPKTVAALDDQALELSDPEDERPLSVDVSYGFHDREGDSLTYTASSSEEARATVVVSGSTVTITPLAEGTTTVTVTATDADGSNTAATLTFEATVADNRSPEPVGTLAARSLPLVDGAVELEVSGSFQDRNSDTLTYAAASSATGVARVSMSGSTLTVTPRWPGSTTVAVTATDTAGSNTRARQWFEATVPNRAPVVRRTIDAMTLRLEDGDQVVDFADRFSDPDRDRLFLEAASSDTSVVDVAETPFGDALDDSFLLKPIAPGETMVTVTATDVEGSDLSVSQSFEVTVPNRTPRSVGELPAMSLRVETGAETIDVAAAFVDPDGDDLTHGASSSHESVATAVAAGSLVTVTPISAGTATVTVTATDPEGSNRSARQTFRATVANRSPRPVGSLEGPGLQVGDGNRRLDVATAFDDPDGDTLTYAAASSAPGVAKPSMSGSVVTLTPLAPGTATITVTATDVTGSNTPATQRFEVRVKARRGITVAPGAITVNEGSTRTYTVVLDSEPTGPVTVTPSVGSNTEISVNPPTLTIDVDDWRTARDVTVEAHQDDDALADAPFTVTHRVAGADYDAVSARPVRVTVVEDDAPTLSVEAPDPVSESDGQLVFQVALSTRSSNEVTVDYATSNGSGASGARAGSDYLEASDTLTFPANSIAARQIVVDIADDADDEAEEETFQLTLSDPRHASLAGGASTLQILGRIRDDDDPEVELSFGSASYGVTEGRTVNVTVRLDRDPERELEIPMEWRHHGGAESTDYSGVPSSVAFGPGVRRQQFPVSATDDAFDDDGEAVVLSFVSLPPRVRGDSETTIAITDNDGSASPSGSGGSGGGGGGGAGGGGGGAGGGGGGGSPPDDEDEDPPPPPSRRPPQAFVELVGAACEEELCRAVTGRAVRFLDASTGSVLSRLWDFGDATTARSGRAEHSWSSPGFYEVTLTVSDGETTSTASRKFLVEAAIAEGTCIADTRTRCLQNSRYAVSVAWRTAGGEVTDGNVVHEGTNDSGLFTFFNRENWEILVKVLDGCALNDHFWVYGASTTDLGYVIRVTDTARGIVREYRNEPGAPAPAITDSEAFHACADRRKPRS